MRALTAIAILLGSTAACERKPTAPAPVDAAAEGAAVAAATTVDAAVADAGLDAALDTDAGTEAAGDGGSLTARARECLAAPSCPATKAEQLFRAADDARERWFPCWRFLDGVGVARDERRARACLERTYRGLDCHDDGLDVGLSDLALMRIDGIGGPANLASGRKLIDGCSEDVAKEELVKHAEAKSRDPATPPLRFCKDIGGTTLTDGECSVQKLEAAKAKQYRVAKVVAAALDPAGIELLAKAQMAYDAYGSAIATQVARSFQGGSLRGIFAARAETTLHEKRRRSLEAFSGFKAADPSAAEVTKALDKVAAPAETEVAWSAFRDAELALYVAAFGAAQGAPKVNATRTISLAKEHLSDLRPPAP